MQDPEASIAGKALSLYDPLIPELKLSPNLLLTLIAQIYVEKVSSDRIRERQDNEPLDFPPQTGMHGTFLNINLLITTSSLVECILVALCTRKLCSVIVVLWLRMCR